MANNKRTKKQVKKKEQTIAEKLIAKEPVYQLNIFIQGIVLILLSLFVIMSIFVNEFSGAVKALLSMLLLVMAYNSLVLFNKKGYAAIYSIIGIYFMVMAVLEAYGS